MGITSFFKLFDKTKLDYSDLDNHSIAVDASIIIHQAASVITLTNKKGKQTSHIYVLLKMINKFQKHGADLIFVFDNPTPPPLKAKELAKRTRSSYITKETIIDCLNIVSMLGIKYCIAPDKVDAEQICAQLNYKGDVDYVLSTDADCFLYRAKSVIKMEKSELMLYTIDDIDLTYDEMVFAGLALGTDFNEKVKGVGIAKVISYCKTMTVESLNDEQKAAYDQFTTMSIMPDIKVEQPNKETLKAYLKENDFSDKTINKLLT